MIGSTLAALADPTRRSVVELLGRSPRRAGDLAEALDITPPAMSRHLRVLRRAGLVESHTLEDDARVRVYRLLPDRFGELRRWAEEIEAFWSAQLGALHDHIVQTRGGGP